MITDDFQHLKSARITRPSEKNPNHPRCTPALRRVCGVCAHFDGTLRDTTPRPCAVHGLAFRATRRAHHCPRWERKTAK